MNNIIVDDKDFFNDISKIKKEIFKNFITKNKINCLISHYELKKDEIEIEILKYKENLEKEYMENLEKEYKENLEKEKNLERENIKKGKNLEKENIKKGKNINNTHSLIISNPINYINFSLSRYCKFIELELEKNDCLFIPRGWFHWIITEPRTISVNYEIYKIESKYENTLYNNLKKNIPYTSKRTNIDIKYDNIIDELIKNNFTGCIVSDGYGDHSPVLKPYSNINKRFDYKRSINIILCDKESKDNYIYVIHQHTNNDIYNKYNKFPDIENNLKNSNNILYTSNLWFNLDKKIQMGIHYDDYDGILSVLDGKKKVFLAPPNEKCKLYLTNTKSMFSPDIY
jgi:hypothetical protein